MKPCECSRRRHTKRHLLTRSRTQRNPPSSESKSNNNPKREEQPPHPGQTHKSAHTHTPSHTSGASIGTGHNEQFLNLPYTHYVT